jgi:site-specific DNA-methyltransferase (adenine-specific)
MMLFNGDMREILAGGKISANSVDLVFTDPPYKITSGGNTSGLMKGGIFDPLVYNNNGNLVNKTLDFAEWVSYLDYVTKPNCEIYCMVNDKNLRDALNAFDLYGWKLHNILIWNKGTPTPNRWYMKETEFILYTWRGTARPITNKGSKQINNTSPLRGNRRVPTEKPVELIQHYILNSTDAGMTVFDPFMGSGSTGEAALINGRQFIGIEQDSATYTITEGRLNALSR